MKFDKLTASYLKIVNETATGEYTTGGSTKQIITKAIDDLKFSASSLLRTNPASANSIFEIIENLKQLLSNE